MGISQKLSTSAKIRSSKCSDSPWMKLPEKNIAFLVAKYPLSVLCILRGFFLQRSTYIWTATGCRCVHSTRLRCWNRCLAKAVNKREIRSSQCPGCPWMKLPEKNIAFLVDKCPLSVLCILRGFFLQRSTYIWTATGCWCVHSTRLHCWNGCLAKAVNKRKNKVTEMLNQPMDEITRKKYCFFGSKVPSFCPVYIEGVFSPALHVTSGPRPDVGWG